MTTNLRCVALRAVLALMLAGAACAPVLAQPAYPNKPVRTIVPSTPAGVLDNVARTLALRLGAQLGQPIVIENKGGAGGNIGAEAAARSPADGYTLFIGFNATHGANLALFGKLSYDPVGDFAPISLLAAVPNIISVTPALPVNSLAELVALAKAKPGNLSYASSGNGTSRRRTVQGGCRHRHRTHSLQGQCAGGDRRHRRPGAGAGGQRGLIDGAGQGRQAEGAGNDQPKAAAGPAGAAHRG